MTSVTSLPTRLLRDLTLAVLGPGGMGRRQHGGQAENLRILDRALEVGVSSGLKRIDAVFPPGLAQGTRQPPFGMGLLDG